MSLDYGSTMNRPDLDPFCPLCEVRLDLHPWETEGEINCDLAKAKADLMELFYGPVL